MSFKNIEYTKLKIDSSSDINIESNFENKNSNFNNIYDNEEIGERHDENSDSFWTYGFYQRLFDINTNDVLKRILYSFIPNPRQCFLKSIINKKPDLYGPFWTCTTLILTIAIAGNMASYFQFDGQKHFWRYDFTKLSVAAMSIYSYWWLMPLFVWGLSKWKKMNESCSLLELVTLYGYSLAIYIPISILWVIQVNWIQWLLVIVALILSGMVLVMSVWRNYNSANKQVSFILVTMVIGMHILLAVGFMLYFFHVPRSNHSATIRVPVSPKPM